MPTATLTDTTTPQVPTVPSTPRLDLLDVVWEELKTYHAGMLLFRDMEPDQVLLAVSGYSARCSEIRAHLCRSQNRAAASFRTNIVEPLLADLEFQFRIHSRCQSIREMDFKVSGGQM